MDWGELGKIRRSPGSGCWCFLAIIRVYFIASAIRLRNCLVPSHALGRFNKFEGEFTYDPAAGPGAQKIQVEVETDSVDSNHAERDKHLRGEKFLDTDEFPTATFAGTEFSGDENDGTMKGEFTLHGVTQPVEVHVTKVGEGEDPWGGYRAGFAGKFSIMRSDYGIKGSGSSSERVELEIYLEGIRR